VPALVARASHHAHTVRHEHPNPPIPNTTAQIPQRERRGSAAARAAAAVRALPPPQPAGRVCVCPPPWGAAGAGALLVCVVCLCVCVRVRACVMWYDREQPLGVVGALREWSVLWLCGHLLGARHTVHAYIAVHMLACLRARFHHWNGMNESSNTPLPNPNTKTTKRWWSPSRSPWALRSRTSRRKCTWR
jgi:hypothetical protein